MHCTNQAHLKDIECQLKMVSSLCQAAKDELIRKYYRKFLVSSISHIELIIYIKKFTIINILG